MTGCGILARRAELARFNPNSYEDFAVLTETPEGLTYHGYSTIPLFLSDDGKTFPTRTEAEAFIQGQERIFENGRCLYP